MPYYIFTFKKGDIELELHASNHRFVAYQVEKWLEDLAGMKIGEVSAKAPAQIKVAPERVVKPEPKAEVLETVVPEIKVEEELVSKVEEIVEPEVEEEPVAPPFVKEIPSPIIEEEILTYEQEEEEESSEVVEEVVTPFGVSLEEEKVIEEPVEEFFGEIESEIEEESAVIEEAVFNIAEEEKPAPSKFEIENEDKFQKILKEKFSSLNIAEKFAKPKEEEKTESSDVVFKSYEDIIKVKKPITMLDYLLVTSFYLKNFEMMDRYSLKQINAKAVPHAKKPIDHAVIQDAVSRRFIEVVPDYTGMAEVTEYAITQEGERVALEM